VRGGVGAHVADVVILLSPRIDLRVPQRGDGMIRGTERQLGMPQRQLPAIERKKATPGEVIEEMPVDQQQVKAFAEIGDRVLSPQLVEQSQRHRTLHAHRLARPIGLFNPRPFGEADDILETIKAYRTM
jgi:hypothetical protein